MGRLEQYLQGIREGLRIYPLNYYLLYQKGVGGVVLPKAKERIDILNPQKIQLIETEKPEVSKNTKKIIEARTPNPKMNNPIPFLKKIQRKRDKAILSLYLGTYKDWRGTLPLNDGHDKDLVKADLMTPFNTTAIPVSKDGYFIFFTRSFARKSWAGLLGGLTGYRLDRDFAENTLQCHKEMLENGTGEALIMQSKGCASYQLNIPPEKVISSDIMGIGMSDPTFCDYGYHSLHIAKIDMNRKEIIDAANEIYGDNTNSRYMRLKPEINSFPFDKDFLIAFADKAPEILDVTQIPLIWLALANEFGKKNLSKIEGLIRRDS